MRPQRFALGARQLARLQAGERLLRLAAREAALELLAEGAARAEHAVNGGGGGRPKPPRPGHVVLSLPRPSVERLTFRDWLVANGLDPNSAPKDQLDDAGVTVDYELRAPGYRSGTTFPLHFRIFRKTGRGDSFVDEFQDAARLEVDSDSCACTSSFIPIPRTTDRYRIEVQIFRPGQTTQAPLEKADTEVFAGPG